MDRDLGEPRLDTDAGKIAGKPKREDDPNFDPYFGRLVPEVRTRGKRFGRRRPFWAPAPYHPHALSGNDLEGIPLLSPLAAERRRQRLREESEEQMTRRRSSARGRVPLAFREFIRDEALGPRPRLLVLLIPVAIVLVGFCEGSRWGKLGFLCVSIIAMLIASLVSRAHGWPGDELSPDHDHHGYRVWCEEPHP